ncbi:DUF1353 domain-containing protein [Phenylobacterium deserti]|uniref:DUF1353 domain-containing protein n=1 Tax=Phenylobacterium deserti TaxID=1914756 RepID=A0A328A9C8_9CAUL|nr:DUF1353 domain-containing protein [Phenylobacterium deserti]RAK50957.1 hypothetical protein DJ018_17500 [Phenylobacterium deserti]
MAVRPAKTTARALDGRLAGAPPGWVNRFGGKLVLVLLDNKYTPSIKKGRSLWGLHDPLTYRPSDAEHTITVPKGFVTDLASIPRWAWTLVPPDGPWVKGAVIHDFLYATRGTGAWKRQPAGNTREAPYTRAEADWILRDALENRGVDVLRRNVIWLAVRLGGGRGWGHDDSRQPRQKPAAGRA